MCTAFRWAVFVFKNKNISFFDKFLLKMFCCCQKTIYICISKNDKQIMNNKKSTNIKK